MKVAIGMRPFDGPWGGGNRFVAALANGLVTAGHDVVHTLEDDDIDIVLLLDPRTRSPNVTFGPRQILSYLANKREDAIVVHRVNECDERKGERVINAKLVRANYVADATVFVGEWLTGLPVWQEHLRSPWFVARNGADEAVFNANGHRPWDGNGPLRLVTHHWGYHRNKGFDVYEMIDQRLDDTAFANRYSMTYIGNLPKGYAFKNVRYVPPRDGEELAQEIRSHHAYLTASINEPGGNHQNEGALCGLPLVYRNSGCMPEYCAGFGIAFDGTHDILAAFDALHAGYPDLAARMPQYPFTAARMVAEWINILDQLHDQRTALLSQRDLRRDFAKYMSIKILA